MKLRLLFHPVAISLAFTTLFSASNVAAPGALRVFVDFKPVLAASQAALVDQPPLGMALKLAALPQNGGMLVTEIHEYASGTLAKDHLAKIAVRRELSDGTWEKVRYKLEIKIEPIGPKETRVVADAFIEGLKRSFTGRTEWVTLASNGNLEDTFLTYVGRKLFGDQFSLETKKRNFWQRDPRYVPGPDSDNNKVAKPEIKRW